MGQKLMYAFRYDKKGQLKISEREFLEKTELWAKTSSQSTDDNDCWPLAVTIITGLSYEEVLAAFTEAGRKLGDGTSLFTAEKACAKLGWKINSHSRWYKNELFDQIKNSYNAKGRSQKNLTLRHPQIHAYAWKDLPLMILRTDGHVSAFKDGKVHDWANNESRVITNIHILERIEND